MPTRRENEKQLERILSSDTFAESPRLIDLLKKLVESEMEGKKPDEYPNEYTLGRDVFGKPEGWIPMDEATVRQSFANLRKRLRIYYSSEGKLDPVYIGFPRRRGYRPTFLHNDASAPVQRCRRGAELFISTFPEIVRKATLPVVQEFESAIKADPLYAPAYSSLAEALVIYSSCDEPYYFSPRERIPQAEKAAKTALKLDASEWLAQITLGAIHCCHWRWQEAGKAFDAALRIAPEETRAHFWYAAYLIAIGKTADAKECIGNWLTASPTSKFGPLIKSLVLYVTRDFDAAYQTLIQTGTEFDFVQDWWAFKTGDEALFCDNWPVEALMCCIGLSMGYSSCWRYAKAAVDHNRVSAFAGLLVLSLGADARLGHADCGERASKLLAQMEEKPEHTGPLSLALAYLGVGKNDAAMANLEKACAEANPFTAWLHLWPVFDPIRDHRAFKKLIRKMSLPG